MGLLGFSVFSRTILLITMRGSKHTKKIFIIFFFILIIFSLIPINSVNEGVVLEEFRGLKLSADVSDYVDQISDLHDPADIGTHSNFNNLQALDDNWDSIAEAQNFTSGDTEILNVSAYDANENNWDKTGSSPYIDAQDDPTNLISVRSNNAEDGWYDFDNPTATYTQWTVVLYFYAKNDDGASNDYFEVYFDPTGFGIGSLAGSVFPDTTYAYYTVDLGTLNDANVDNGRIYVKYKRSGGADDVYIDYAYMNATGVGTAYYELDLEMGWTSADFDEANEELCIYADVSDIEALVDDFSVDVWDDSGGQWVEVIEELVDNWNNVSISSYLTDSTLEIRIIDEFATDNQQDTLLIDAILLHVWTAEEESNPPTYGSITESADPLELGNSETISIQVYDESNIDFVYLEHDSFNYTMTQQIGDWYTNNTWVPATVGVHVYQIHMIDEFGNTNQTSDLNITVQDTTNPVISNIVESADPLELGLTETIEADITDFSTMTWVYLEFEGSNNSMSIKAGITWEYTSWTPTIAGLYPYTIWANDSEGNIGSDSTGNITVQDTTNPVVDNIVESADPLFLTDTETIQADITDYSTMTWVYLEFEGSNNSMSFIGGITWEYDSWTPPSTGNYPYTVWANDSEGNIGSASGDITVTDDLGYPSWDNLTEIDPLELGLNETITITVFDDDGVLFVYLEFGGSNHSMTNSSGIYSYSNWLPNATGVYEYTIWFSDTLNNIGSIAGDILVVNTPYMVISVLTMFSFIFIMLISYVKMRYFLLITAVFGFSLLAGITFLIDFVVPFSPYFQLFFLLFQSSIFIMTTIQYREEIR